VYHPKCAGSYSIKNVRPALVPGMTYEGMEVRKERKLGLLRSLPYEAVHQAERVRIRKALLDDCGRDTLALVKVLEKLGQVRQNPTRQSFPGTSTQSDRSPVE
jgi:hypothetical protein